MQVAEVTKSLMTLSYFHRQQKKIEPRELSDCLFPVTPWFEFHSKKPLCLLSEWLMFCRKNSFVNMQAKLLWNYYVTNLHFFTRRNFGSQCKQFWWCILCTSIFWALCTILANRCERVCLSCSHFYVESINYISWHWMVAVTDFLTTLYLLLFFTGRVEKQLWLHLCAHLVFFAFELWLY